MACRLGSRVCTGVIAALMLWTFWAEAHAAPRVALVIGNGSYQNVPALPNPSKDAAAIAGSLTRLGFGVRMLKDASFDDMRRALLDFGTDAREAEIAIVYFAGHGIEVGGENWLIPVDAHLKSDVDPEQEAISLKSLTVIASTASKLGLVILDACRNNPFQAKMQYSVRTRAVSRGLARIEPFGSVLVAYAAKDGTTAEDGDGNHSPFSAALLKYLEQPGLEINFLFRNVRDEVLVQTAHRQEPFVYGSLSKEAIYLKSAIERPATQFIPSPPSAPTPDEITWSFLKDSKDIAALKRFVAEFPNSREKASASQRIASLETDAKTDEAMRRTAARREVARSLQLELKRIGCFDGAVDGEFGDSTRIALQKFAKLSSVRLPDEEPSSDALNALRRFDRRVCPPVCPEGERADDEKCVRITCPTGQVLKGTSCIGKRTAEGDTAGRRTPPPAPTSSSSAKCFSFQGRRFCE